MMKTVIYAAALTTLAAPAHAQTCTRDSLNKYFSGFAADPKVEAPFATPCHRWEGGVQTTVKPYWRAHAGRHLARRNEAGREQ